MEGAGRKIRRLETTASATSRNARPHTPRDRPCPERKPQPRGIHGRTSGERYRRSFPGERRRADLRSHFHRPHDTSGVQRLPARKGVCGRRFRGVVQRSGARVVHTHAGRVTAVATPRTAPAGTIFGRRVRGVHRDPLRFDARRNRRTHGIYARKGVGNSSRIPALPPQEEAAAENPEKNLTTSIRYDHARRRRSARLGQSRGFHAGDQLSVSRHSHLLVLLRVVCADRMNDFRRRPHPAKFPADGCLVLIDALHQTLLHGISRIVVHGKPWCEGRENIVETYHRGRRHRHTAILWQRLAARDECRYDPAGGALYGDVAGGIPRNAGGRAMEQPSAEKPYDG